MRFRLQLITVSEDGSERMHSVAELERDSTLRLETTGLTLAEGKQILKHLQEVVVEEQVQACMVEHRHCAICSKPLSTKGHHQIKLQTVFGNPVKAETCIQSELCAGILRNNRVQMPILAVFERKITPRGHFEGDLE